MAGKYAQGTEVPAERSRGEVERTVREAGATRFAYGWDRTAATIQFELSDRRIRLRLPLPSPEDDAFVFTESGNVRSESAIRALYEKESRRRWRALALVLKAKLTAVDEGISTLEDEFLSFFVMPDGSTVGERVKPQMDRALATNNLPPLLPEPKP